MRVSISLAILLLLPLATAFAAEATEPAADSAEPAAAQLSFGKVELLTGFGQAKEGDKGRLVFDADGLRFLDQSWNEYFNLPASAVKELRYSQAERGRSGSPLKRPLELLQGKKHYLTLTFELDGLAGAVEFKLHKSNYENVLRNAEIATGLEMHREEPEAEAAEVAAAAPQRAKESVLRITSDPPGAEVEINNTFNGLSPRGKVVKPGEYLVAVKLEGHEPWQRRVEVAPGETLKVHAELADQH